MFYVKSFESDVGVRQSAVRRDKPLFLKSLREQFAKGKSYLWATNAKHAKYDSGAEQQVLVKYLLWSLYLPTAGRTDGFGSYRVKEERKEK